MWQEQKELHNHSLSIPNVSTNPYHFVSILDEPTRHFADKGLLCVLLANNIILIMRLKKDSQIARHPSGGKGLAVCFGLLKERINSKIDRFP